MQLRNNQTGFTAAEGLLIAVVVAIIAFTGWFVWHSQQKTDETFNDANKVQNAPQLPKGDNQSDFEKCRNAEGSRLLQTYPEQCVTKDGKTYTSAAVSNPVTPSGQKHLAIKEWNVSVQFTYADKLNYIYNKVEIPAGGYLDVPTDSSVSLALKPEVGAAENCQQLDLKWARSTQKSVTVEPLSKVGNYYFYTWGDGASRNCGATVNQILTRTTAEQVNNPFVAL